MKISDQLKRIALYDLIPDMDLNCQNDLRQLRLIVESCHAAGFVSDEGEVKHPKEAAWSVGCPVGHEYDVMLFGDKNDAFEQAELFNDDYHEGENPHVVTPLYLIDIPAAAKEKP